MGRRIVVMKLICSLGHCEYDGHTVHKLSQRRLTADRLAPLRSPLTGCQVTSRPRDRFSRYSKWLDTIRTVLVCLWATSVPNFIYLATTNSHISSPDKVCEIQAFAFYLTIEAPHDPSEPLEILARHQIICINPMYFEAHNN